MIYNRIMKANIFMLMCAKFLVPKVNFFFFLKHFMLVASQIGKTLDSKSVKIDNLLLNFFTQNK